MEKFTNSSAYIARSGHFLKTGIIINYMIFLVFLFVVFRWPFFDEDCPMYINWGDVNWEDIIGRLVLFANYRMHRMVWRGNYRSSLLPRGSEPMDFVQQAIFETISGVRKWDPLNVSLYEHLAGVVKSKINHLAESYENKYVSNYDDMSNKDDEKTRGVVVNFPDLRGGQECDLAEEYEKAFLLKYLHDKDVELEKIAELMLSGTTKSLELASQLDISIDRVNNLKKRLRRAVSGYLDEQRLNQVSRA